MNGVDGAPKMEHRGAPEMVHQYPSPFAPEMVHHPALLKWNNL
jgi:hypothetical protein